MPQTAACCPRASTPSAPLTGLAHSREPCLYVGDVQRLLLAALSPQPSCSDPLLHFRTPPSGSGKSQPVSLQVSKSKTRGSSCVFSCHSWTQRGCFLFCTKLVAGSTRNVLSRSCLLDRVFLSCPASLGRPRRDSYRFFVGKERRACLHCVGAERTSVEGTSSSLSLWGGWWLSELLAGQRLSWAWV